MEVPPIVRPSSTRPHAKRIFDLELTALQTNFAKQASVSSPYTPNTASVNTNALSELRDIFNSSPLSPMFAPIPERNVRNRRPSFLQTSVDMTKLLAQFSNESDLGEKAN
ncbi:hypothetical protein HDU91_001738 [Kappamyces sp. JEL0680]|nr:hypothetical protein HDU91_001738 [Kappamyces sp. JEL0680]